MTKRSDAQDKNGKTHTRTRELHPTFPPPSYDDYDDGDEGRRVASPIRPHLETLQLGGLGGGGHIAI